MNKRCAWVMLAALISLPAFAITIERPLPEIVQERRAQQIFAALKCVVCEGQPLAESDAELAIDMRHSIRQKVARGETTQTIIRYFETRYGEAILMRPPVTQHTLPLWLMPLLLLCVGLGIFWRNVRRGKP
jgi:cytochrome c-type biogenesis protein CcmH